MKTFGVFQVYEANKYLVRIFETFISLFDSTMCINLVFNFLIDKLFHLRKHYSSKKQLQTIINLVIDNIPTTLSLHIFYVQS